MGRYLTPLFFRFLQFFLSLALLIILTFGLLRFFPGSPLNEETSLDPQVVDSLRKFYGLDQGFFDQFCTYLNNLFHGDGGVSMHFIGRSVNSLIWEFGQTSLVLGGLAFFTAVVFSFCYLFLSRVFLRRGRGLDQVVLVLISIPSIALGPLAIWFFSFYLRLFPVALLESPISYVLPVLLLSFKPSLTLARILSSSVDEVLQEDFIQTARALGFSQTQVILKWALKNSMTSYLSQLGPLFAGLISGSFLVEVLFAIPGLGYQFVQSVLNRDWPLILGLTLVYGGVLMLAQLVTDLLIVWSDPRVSSI